MSRLLLPRQVTAALLNAGGAGLCIDVDDRCIDVDAAGGATPGLCISTVVARSRGLSVSRGGVPGERSCCWEVSGWCALQLGGSSCPQVMGREAPARSA